MAYQSYSAYHPPTSHSNALRPTLNTNFAQGTSYEPLHTNDVASPGASPHQMQPPFAQQHTYSSESINSGRYYGAGGVGAAGPPIDRTYSDDIPLRQQPPSDPFMDPSTGQGQGQGKGTKGPINPFVNEAALSEEEVNREARRQARRGRERKKKGILHRVAWVCWFMTLVQLAVFIGELVRASIETGTPIQTKPQFNPMIGPSTYVIINMGARFVPCMRDPKLSGYGDTITATTNWQCPNSTSLDASLPENHCTLAELCGMGAAPTDFPLYQWWRFITPIFLHAGIIHIGFNLLLQMTLGREIENLIGSIRFLIVYLASGIFGFVLGGNYAAPAIPSVGCSGSLFGITAISLLDLLYTWHKRRRPFVELGLIFLEICVSFALGLLPGLDNFSHIGGFLIGLVLGMCLLRSPDRLRKRIRPHSIAKPATDPSSPTSPVDGASQQRAQVASYAEFTRKPLGFFQGRKPLWWAWWLVRAGCLVAVIAAFIVLVNNFLNYPNDCVWCRYLSCLPVNGWCDIGRIGTNTTTSGNGRRALFEAVLTSGY